MGAPVGADVKVTSGTFRTASERLPAVAAMGFASAQWGGVGHLRWPDLLLFLGGSVLLLNFTLGLWLGVRQAIRHGQREDPWSWFDEAAAGDPKTVQWYDAGHGLTLQASRDRMVWLQEHLGMRAPDF